MGEQEETRGKQLYLQAENLVARLVECRQNPRELSLTELYIDYGKIVNTLDGAKPILDRMLVLAASKARFHERLANKLPEFFDHGYKTVVESEMGDAKHAYDASNPEQAKQYLDKVTGKHQAEGFEPLETGVIPGVNTTMTFKPEFIKNAMKQLEDFFSEEQESEADRKKRLSETSRIAKFDDTQEKPKDANDDKSNPAKGALTSIFMG
jgi:hypothetical protein